MFTATTGEIEIFSGIDHDVAKKIITESVEVTNAYGVLVMVWNELQQMLYTLKNDPDHEFYLYTTNCSSPKLTSKRNALMKMLIDKLSPIWSHDVEVIDEHILRNKQNVSCETNRVSISQVRIIK